MCTLIDSGASTDFIDLDFVERLQMAMQRSEPLLVVQTIDGWPLLAARVSEAMMPVGLGLPSHRETITFHVTRLATHPVVLGMTRLSRHDPVIAWGQRSITFALAYCRLHCLGGRGPERAEVGGAEALGALTGNERQLPPPYKTYQDVFCEKEADRLPPHRPYDCKIELLPGAQLPISCLYSM